MAITPGLPRTFAVNNPQLLESLKDIDFSDMNAGYWAWQLWSLIYDPLNPCKTFSFQQVCWAPCSGWSFACIDITRAQAISLANADSLNSCSFYRITDRNNLVVRAWDENSFENQGYMLAPASSFPTTGEIILVDYDITSDTISYIKDIRNNEYYNYQIAFGSLATFMTNASFGNPNISSNKYYWTTIDYSALSNGWIIQHNRMTLGSVTATNDAQFRNNEFLNWFIVEGNNKGKISQSVIDNSNVLIQNNDELIWCTIVGQIDYLYKFNTNLTHKNKAIQPWYSNFSYEIDMTGTGNVLGLTEFIWAWIVYVSNDDDTPTLDLIVFPTENHKCTVRMNQSIVLSINTVSILTALASEISFISWPGTYSINWATGDEFDFFKKDSNAFNYMSEIRNRS